MSAQADALMDVFGFKRIATLDADAAEFYEERAAILQHMAGWPKEKAEALALAEAQAYQNAKERAKE
jgi:hypothetical protein